jgi:sec-independent protein translocase protein TatA
MEREFRSLCPPFPASLDRFKGEALSSENTTTGCRNGINAGGVPFEPKKGAYVIAFLQGIGAPELIIILVIVLLLFGAKKLPEMARSLGKSQREFKKGMREGAEEADLEGSDRELKEPEKKPIE